MSEANINASGANYLQVPLPNSLVVLFVMVREA